MKRTSLTLSLLLVLFAGGVWAWKIPFLDSNSKIFQENEETIIQDCKNIILPNIGTRFKGVPQFRQVSNAVFVDTYRDRVRFDVENNHPERNFFGITCMLENKFFQEFGRTYTVVFLDNFWGNEILNGTFLCKKRSSCYYDDPYLN